MKTILKIILIIALIAIIAITVLPLIFAGVVVDVVNTELNATPVPTVVHNVGDEVALADRTIVIGTPAIVTPSEYLTVADNIEILEIPLKVLNSSSQDIYIYAPDFKVYKNNVLCEDYVYGDHWFAGETVSSGRAFEGYLYCQVPVSTGDSVLELEYTYDYHGSKVIFKIN